MNLLFNVFFKNHAGSIYKEEWATVYWRKTPRGRGGRGKRRNEVSHQGRGKKEKDEILTPSKSEGSG